MVTLEVPVAVGGDCQLIGFGDGGVVSTVDCASVVALAVAEAVLVLPAASRACTLYE